MAKMLQTPKEYRGIVIDIWGKSYFFGSFRSQKGAKNPQPPPLMSVLTVVDNKEFKLAKTHTYQYLKKIITLSYVDQ